MILTTYVTTAVTFLRLPNFSNDNFRNISWATHNMTISCRDTFPIIFVCNNYKNSDLMI